MQHSHGPAEPPALTLLKHPGRPWLNASQCPVLPPPIPGEPARRAAQRAGGGAQRKAPDLVSSLLGFPLAGSCKRWAGFNPGLLTAQLLCTRSPGRRWLEEPLALLGLKYSLRGLATWGGRTAVPVTAGQQRLQLDYNPGFYS